MVEPIWTMGPSRPTEPPVPMVNAEARDLTSTMRGRMNPPLVITAAITSGTPWPLASGAKREMSGPTIGPPRAGVMMMPGHCQGVSMADIRGSCTARS